MDPWGQFIKNLREGANCSEDNISCFVFFVRFSLLVKTHYSFVFFPFLSRELSFLSVLDDMDIYRELIEVKNYRQVFASLEQKARKEPYRRKSSPIQKGLPLSWILENETLVTRILVKALKKKKYSPEPCRQIELLTDKKRILYSNSWPDRIIEGLLAALLVREVEPHLSVHLYSFRKGRSNFEAVQNFSKFAAASHKQGEPVFIFRHDIASYGESICRASLMQKLRSVLGKQDLYLWSLLESYLAPQYLSSTDNELSTLTTGLPSGFALTPVCENLYLSELDRLIEQQPGIFYARFGDDILLSGNSYQKTIAANEITLNLLRQHELSVKKEKEKVLCFVPDRGKIEAGQFAAGEQVDYLGFSINREGKIFLSQNKITKLKSELRSTAKHAYKAALRTTTKKDRLTEAVIKNINIFFERELEQAYFPLLLSTVTDIERLRQLDKWVAKVTLRYIYGSGHDRVFRYQSYASLRKRGLKSLLHLRNLAWRKQ